MPYKDPEVARQKAKERQRKYREKNKEKLRIKNLGRYHAIYKKIDDPEIKERRAKYMKEWRANNQDKIKACHQKEEQKEKARIRVLKYQKNNRGKVRARSRMRKKVVRQATPAWVDKKIRSEITELYVTAVELESKTGIKYHVDHIVPLVNDRVCGLHVPWNLRVIPASENLKKGNKF